MSSVVSCKFGCTFCHVLSRVDIGGVVIYQSPLLNELRIPHAFSTRLGGVSAAPFDSLNLGNPNGCAIQDKTEQIEENYRRLRSAAGIDRGELIRVHQVHGPKIAHALAGKPFDIHQQADAIVTGDRNRTASIRVADCVPVLLASTDGCVVAAVHAGWRGVIAQVAVAALKAMDCPTRQIVAAIGPCIGMDAFEVGPDVLQAFNDQLGSNAPIRRRPDGKGYVDLRQTLRRQLISAGVPAERIDTTDRCTFRDGSEFFSHRRDNGVTGRMAAIIAPRQ